MGLKSGSRDAGLDDESDENSEATDETTGDGEHAHDTASDPESRENEPPAAETGGRSANDTSDRSDSTEDAPAGETGRTSDGRDESSGAETTNEPDSSDETEEPPTDDRPSVESLPYVLRRDRVNEGRDQVPFFLREEVVDGERELRETLEATLGEDVYKSDLREAAMVVAQEQPELVAEVLRRWGYDLS